MAIRGYHAGADVRVLHPRSADRPGTVERPYSRRAVSAGMATGGRRGSYQPVEPRNGLPVLALYEWRRGGRVSKLTARIMAEIGPGKGT